MILDEDMTQNLQKELKELNEKNGEENNNLCHKLKLQASLEGRFKRSC